ncbi:MAG: DUF421 domain-containing protein [Enhydrobacter sp.]|nr:DUF421 domain-containing protein [Enhydrobacter sp.]
MNLEPYFSPVNWAEILFPTESILETVVRATMMYFIIFVLLRIVLRRQVGGLGTSDILVVVLVAEIAGNGITADSYSVIGGAVSVATVLFWAYVIEWLQYHVPFVERLTREPKLKLIADGKLLRRNMRIELVTEEELMVQLRKQGVDDCAKVKAAYLEADGSVSVVRVKDED